ncbi:hypothetical protein JZ751_028448 [Albula glossodonta]|uniref:Uncharacterized protein n=1 Tax=Albula glossodonta TaxID=121402 RepID=A0A8T2NMH1_9TELE|nr:hypothetical protein JZ751_028448 [Albula glossodonta]
MTLRTHPKLWKEERPMLEPHTSTAGPRMGVTGLALLWTCLCERLGTGPRAMLEGSTQTDVLGIALAALALQGLDGPAPSTADWLVLPPSNLLFGMLTGMLEVDQRMTHSREEQRGQILPQSVLTPGTHSREKHMSPQRVPTAERNRGAHITPKSPHNREEHRGTYHPKQYPQQRGTQGHISPQKIPTAERNRGAHITPKNPHSREEQRGTYHPKESPQQRGTQGHISPQAIPTAERNTGAHITPKNSHSREEQRGTYHPKKSPQQRGTGRHISPQRGSNFLTP